MPEQRRVVAMRVSATVARAQAAQEYLTAVARNHSRQHRRCAPGALDGVVLPVPVIPEREQRDDFIDELSHLPSPSAVPLFGSSGPMTSSSPVRRRMLGQRRVETGQHARQSQRPSNRAFRPVGSQARSHWDAGVRVPARTVSEQGRRGRVKRSSR